MVVVVVGGGVGVGGGSNLAQVSLSPQVELPFSWNCENEFPSCSKILFDLYFSFIYLFFTLKDLSS